MKNGDYIFHRDGRPIKPIRRAWNTACKKVELDGRLSHDLRWSAVRNAIESGLSEHYTMILCGHKTNHMLYRYHLVAERDLKQAMLKMVRPKTVPIIDTDEAQFPQLLDFTSWKRIGAGVSPGLQNHPCPACVKGAV